MTKLVVTRFAYLSDYLDYEKRYNFDSYADALFLIGLLNIDRLFLISLFKEINFKKLVPIKNKVYCNNMHKRIRGADLYFGQIL